MTQQIRIGILGCGVITQRTLPGLIATLANYDAQIVSLCDISQENISAVLNKLNNTGVNCFTSLQSMLADQGINTLMIATPISMHYDNVKAGLDAGCHVYTHKTLAPTAEQCEQLADLAKQRQCRLAASPGQVLLPAYQRAKALIQSGELGTVISVDAAAEAAPHRYESERAHENPESGQPFSWEWYHRNDRCGGPLDDMFVYPLAFLTEVFGQVCSAYIHAGLHTQEIHWKGRTIKADAPDLYSGVIRFKNAVATMRSSFSSNSSRVPWGFISIRGTQASLEIEKQNDLEYQLYITPNEGEARVEKLDVFNSLKSQTYGSAECHVLTDMNEFMAAITEDRDVLGATADNAARVAHGISLIKQSANNNQGKL